MKYKKIYGDLDDLRRKYGEHLESDRLNRYDGEQFNERGTNKKISQIVQQQLEKEFKEKKKSEKESNKLKKNKDIEKWEK